MEFVLIPGGDFQMGWEQDRVHVDSFYLGKYEVTNAQWKKFVDANPEWRKDQIKREYHNGAYLQDWKGNTPPPGKENYPVVWVSWYAAVAYGKWAGVRLPTEAEWKYAAQGGKGYEYGTKDGTLSHDLANYAGTEGKDRWERTSPVGSFPPNPFAIYDLCGNVGEWCSSECKLYPYRADDGREAMQPNVRRVVRGGSWLSAAFMTSVRCCSVDAPASTSNDIGLRCARAPRP
jgi:formylglycine-generating enzyme required for sulfatase activity